MELPEKSGYLSFDAEIQELFYEKLSSVDIWLQP